MAKKVKVLVLALAFLVGAKDLAFAQDQGAPPPTTPTRKQIDIFLEYALPPLMKGEMEKIWGLAPDHGYGPREASCLYGPLATPPGGSPLTAYSLVRELAAVAKTDLPGRGIVRVYPPASLVNLRGGKAIFAMIDYRDFPERLEFPAFAPPRPMGLIVRTRPAPAGQSFPWGSWCPQADGGNPLARLDDTLYYNDFIARVEAYLGLLAKKIR
jgi:hypothetical protein